MYPPGRSLFRECALSSGLVSSADIELARSELRSGGGAAVAESAISDQQLADKLVELGRLNSYQSAQLLAGRTKLNLGPYRILDSIGQGGMGQVFKAEHVMMGRIVAVKVLPRAKSTPEAIISFTREIRAQAKLDHEHLVRAFDAGHDGNVYFLVTEYIPGTDLRRYVRNRGPLDMQEAATIISQAADGLEHAHQLGLVHRDVKPGNLLVTPEGHAKVSDLGLAGWLNDAEATLQPGKIVGTADYLPPEQIMAPGTVTPAGDIYSLGCTLYYAVTGKVPFPGGNAREKAHRHCTDTPLHPRHLNPSLGDEFIEVMADMMKKDPQTRIQSAAEVVRRLAPWAGESVPAPTEPDETAGVPPRANIVPPPQADDLEDTAASFAGFLDVAPVDTESLSQTSQGTEPVASADQETLPNVAPGRIAVLRGNLWGKIRDASPLVLALIILAPIALVAVLAVLIAMLQTIGQP
jgi:eukaryotic-like serine/threonine-protein kinase